METNSLCNVLLLARSEIWFASAKVIVEPLNANLFLKEEVKTHTLDSLNVKGL